MNSRFVSASQYIPILTYHQIADTPPKGTPFRSLCVTPRDFARQMQLLKTLGYQGLSMEGLLPYLKGEKFGKVVGITFDDGYRNNLEHALPVLRAQRFTSTCYVVSQQIGATNQWDLEVGIPQVPLMSKEELLSWIGEGQEIGAHTRNHLHLSRLVTKQASIEISQCKAELESILETPVNHFCYPYGDFDGRIADLVDLACYTTATTTRRGRCKAGDAYTALPRVPVVRTTTLLALWWKLVSSYEDKKGQTPSFASCC
jgi:peptidoglycan/xylan/chitin deacetylase (PgdA/CDA1 family)